MECVGGMSDSAAFNAASLLILDHQLSQKLEVHDVIRYLSEKRMLSSEDVMHITDGATEKIRRDRLLAKLRLTGVYGYWSLRDAMSMYGIKYSSLVRAIDNTLPQSRKH